MLENCCSCGRPGDVINAATYAVPESIEPTVGTLRELMASRYVHAAAAASVSTVYEHRELHVDWSIFHLTYLVDVEVVSHTRFLPPSLRIFPGSLHNTC